MKDFVKMTLAVICGLIIMGVLTFLLASSFLGAALLAGSSKPAVPKSGILTLDMSKISLGEQTVESNPLLSDYSGGSVIGIWDAVQTINAAASDPAVKCLYLLTDGLSASAASLQELRAALANFRVASGKSVISYIEAPTSGSYYLASVADKVYMTPHPGATTMVNGSAAQMVFLGDLLNKLGVNVQLIRHGKYKSAGEMFTRNSSSPENREQYQRLVSSTWESLSGEMAASRGISVASLNSSIDNLELNLPQDFLRCGLVDELLTFDQLRDKLAVLSGKDSYKDVSLIPFADYMQSKLTPTGAKKNIAIIYASGNIVDGKATTEVAGDRFASIIAKVRADSTVKAVVLRVNSPGGSVLASEKIKNELDSLKAVKPLIASYGDYAASGGYWISNNCDKIYSDATTLTGSIGVFGMVPDFSKTAKDVLHIGVETVSSSAHGDMYALTRPLDKAEYDYMFRSIETIYDRFTTVVSEGRSIPKETVDAVGQGRVWTGADALTINLVDEIGTLSDAVNYAASVAGDPDLAGWNIVGYPRTQNQWAQIIATLTGSGEEDASLSAVLGSLRSTDHPAGSYSIGDYSQALVEMAGQLSSPAVLARMDTEIRIK